MNPVFRLNCRDVILRMENRSTAISLSMPVFVHDDVERSCAERGPPGLPSTIMV